MRPSYRRNRYTEPTLYRYPDHEAAALYSILAVIASGLWTGARRALILLACLWLVARVGAWLA